MANSGQGPGSTVKSATALAFLATLAISMIFRFGLNTNLSAQGTAFVAVTTFGVGFAAASLLQLRKAKK